MLRRTFLLAVVLGLTIARSLPGSEEKFLRWSEVRIACPEREDTGKVVFAAKAGGDKLQEVRLEAFGKQFTLGKEDLEKLHGFPLSSLVTTHEAGYERLGGHTVHFKFKKRYYDKPGDNAANLIEETIIISVSRGQGLNVGAPRRRVLDK